MKPSVAFAFLALLASPLTAAAENRISIEKDVRVNAGEVVDSAASVFGNVNVDGLVKESAVSLFGDVVVNPTGQVDGDAVSLGGTVYRIEGSTVAGKVRAAGARGGHMGKLFLVGLPMAVATAAIAGAVVVVASSVGFVALVVLILLLFPAQVEESRRVLTNAPFRSLAYGFLGFLALIPLVVFLAVTIIGIPLAIGAAAVAMAAICLGAVAGCDWLGRELATRMKRPLQPVWSGLLGLAVLFLLGFVPVLGSVIHAAVVFAGLGAVMQSRFRGAAPSARG